ncbi:MAG: OmpA family protein [Planctomycetota bacterium]|jgi:chemotaxis protein MotB
MINTRTLRRATALALLLPALTGCATQEQLSEYKDEIEQLRARNQKLQRDNDSLNSRLQSVDADLAEANMRVEEAMAPPSYPGLDDLGVDVSVRGNALVLSIPSSITFASGSADLSDAGQRAVAAVAGVLNRDHPNAEYWIEGHTDSQQPSRSSFQSNRQLSVARAMTVLEYLVTDCNVPDDNCVVAGHGEYEPIAGNDSAEGMATNRRVEIIVQQQG